MTLLRRFFRVVVPLTLIVLVCGFEGNVTDSAFIATAAPAYEPLAALHGGERFPQGARLLIDRNGDAEPLLKDFAASADANVSFDAKAVLFAGKKTAHDAWQIWELTLADRSVRQVSAGMTEAIRPFYLPGRRVVFARRTAKGSFQVAVADLDGKSESPLTYMPANAIPTDVLADGRILFEAGFPLGSGAKAELYLVYSDGSGVESYRCDHGPAAGPGRWGGHQVASGDVVFTHGLTLARFTSPLAAEAGVPAPRAEYAGPIAETSSGEWLLSVRPAAGGHYALKLWKPELEIARDPKPAAMITVLAMGGDSVVEPVLLAPRERPRQHPSALHDWKYANLLALDARQTRAGVLKATPVHVRLETMDASGRVVVLGTAAIEGDGSFFVKAPADRPVRFALLDKKDAMIRQERGWFWIRGGEQRICVGCHTGPERAAENQVPAVLLRSTTPTDLSVADTSNAARPNPQGSR
jgi:hypothetical protein